MGFVVVCLLNFLLCSVCILFRKTKRFFKFFVFFSVLSVKGVLSCGLMNPISLLTDLTIGLLIIKPFYSSDDCFPFQSAFFPLHQ